MTKKHKYCLSALDTLFFRDGRPFSMGSENWADGVFPPAPSVIHGALRSAYFGENPEDFCKVNTEDDPTRQLSIACFSLYMDNEPIFPLPLDCVVDKQSETNRMEEYAERLTLHKLDLISSSAMPYALIHHEKDKIFLNPTNSFISSGDLCDYLALSVEQHPFISLSNHILHESKIGIGIESSSRSVGTDGRLYRVDMKRLSSHIDYGESKISFYVEFEGLSLPDCGVLKFGGEGKAAAYNKLDDNDIKAPTLEVSKFKLYFATPAIFESGWIPRGMNPDTFIWDYRGIKLQLLTAAIGKHLHIGGFDMEQKRPKTMRRAVPAGSVYYFEILNGSMKDAIRIFHGQRISDDENDCRQGFGLTYAGGIDE